MGNLTDLKIRSAKPKSAEYKLNDGDGLYVRIYASGRKVFALRYKVKTDTGHSQKLLELGDYGTKAEGNLTLAEARTKAEQARAQRREGIDPVEAKQAKTKARELAKVEAARELAKLEAEQSVAQLVDAFYRKHVANKFKSEKNWRWLVDGNIVAHIGKLKVKDVTRANLITLLDTVHAGKKGKPAPVLANRTLKELKALFAFAVEQGHIEHSPAAVLTRKSAGGAEKSRERALSPEEIRELLTLLNSTNHSYTPHTVAVLKLLLLTGQRLGEVLSAKWSHINQQTGEWTLPVTKNGKQHVVHLQAEALDILNDLHRTVHGEAPKQPSAYIFASPKGTSTKPMQTRSVAKALSRMFETKALTCATFTAHDLRRTFVTQLAGLKVEPHVIEKLVNHTMPGVAGVYNREEYLPQRKQALLLWSKHLQTIQADQTNVVAFKAIAK